MIDEFHPEQGLASAGIPRPVVQRADLDMSDQEKARLLHVVDELDQWARRARVGHQQQHLRPPELDVRLPRVQQQQVFPHLEVADGRGQGGVSTGLR